MTSVCRRALLGLAVGLVAATASRAGPLPVSLRCGGPLLLAGGSAMQPPERYPTISRPLSRQMQGFVAKACGRAVEVRHLVEPTARLTAAQPGLESLLKTLRPAMVLLDYPDADLRAGVGVEEMIERYRSIARTCDAVSAVCVIGGQRPVEAGTADLGARQVELERRAAAAFGMRYLSTHAHFRSERPGRSAMAGMTTEGPDPELTEPGHDLLFRLNRNRLLELTAATR